MDVGMTVVGGSEVFVGADVSGAGKLVGVSVSVGSGALVEVDVNSAACLVNSTSKVWTTMVATKLESKVCTGAESERRLVFIR